MKVLLNLALTLVALTQSLVAEVAPEDLATLEELLTQRDAYSHIYATVEQEKVIPSIADPLITHGKVWMIPQQAFRWELGRPVTDFAILREDEVYVYDKRSYTYEKHDADSRKVRPIMLLLGMGEDASYNGLLDNFKPTAVVKNKKSFMISFLPDSGLMKRALKQLVINFDLRTGFPSEVVWEQKDGSIITTTFHKPSFKAFSPDTIFALPSEPYAKN